MLGDRFPIHLGFCGPRTILSSLPTSHSLKNSMPIKVCFVALNAYPAIDPTVAGSFGGIETRSWLFARELATLPGFEVSFLVRHWHPLRQKSYEGVTLHLMRDRFYPVRDSLLSRIERLDHFPWMQLHRPQLSDAFFLPLLAGMKAMKRKPDPCEPSSLIENIDADIFLTFGVQSFSATVIATGKASHRPVTLFLGSDSDLDEQYLPGGDFVSVYRDRADVCYWAIQNADLIFCQTKSQQQRLESLFHRESQLIRNPVDVQQWDELATQEVEEKLHGNLRRYALWVGRADAVHKQPQVLLEVAKLCPGVDFLMIMNRRDDIVEVAIKQSAPANVQIVDHVPFAKMPAIFSKAAVLVNTSSLEGFPNTYLQSATSGVPIASLNVETDFLKASQSGMCAEGNLDRLAEYVQEVWNDEVTIAQSGKEYVAEHHDLQRQTTILANALKR